VLVYCRQVGTPSVSITRIHGQYGAAGITDAPSAFTGGCTPESTQYCRQNAVAAPIAAPVFAPPAPIIARPAPVAERVVHIGGGYDPSKFIPRTYGSNELTPGIAHIPTSIVDRSHANATAVLNSGTTRPQSVVSGGVVPHPSIVGGTGIVSQGTIAPVIQRGIVAPAGSNVVGVVNQTVRLAPNTNVYPGSLGADGTYYEKVSGPTLLGGTQATQIICKRQAPTVNVQRQVIGVPSPVPTPVLTQCAPISALAGGPRFGSAAGRYGSSFNNSWGNNRGFSGGRYGR